MGQLKHRFLVLYLCSFEIFSLAEFSIIKMNADNLSLEQAKLLGSDNEVSCSGFSWKNQS